MLDSERAGPVQVPRAVLCGLRAVRQSGRTNMLDRHCAAAAAEELGYSATAKWISEHPDLYSRGIFRGFVERR